MDAIVILESLLFIAIVFELCQLICKLLELQNIYGILSLLKMVFSSVILCACVMTSIAMIHVLDIYISISIHAEICLGFWWWPKWYLQSRTTATKEIFFWYENKCQAKNGFTFIFTTDFGLPPLCPFFLYFTLAISDRLYCISLLEHCENGIRYSGLVDLYMYSGRDSLLLSATTSDPMTIDMNKAPKIKVS